MRIITWTFVSTVTEHSWKEKNQFQPKFWKIKRITIFLIEESLNFWNVNSLEENCTIPTHSIIVKHANISPTRHPLKHVLTLYKNLIFSVQQNDTAKTE